MDPKKGFESWDLYVDALFCESKNLQVLCKACHKIKTKEEKSKSTKASKQKTDE